MFNDIFVAYSTANPLFNRLLIISAITFLVGYIEYIYSIKLVIKEGSAPFPLWMHTLYLAHDFSGGLIFLNLAYHNNWFWFFTAAGIALLLWNFFEIFNLYKALTVERSDIWGENTSFKTALKEVIMQVLFMFAFVNFLRFLMDDTVMFKWFALTNIVMAIGPGYYWQKKQSTKGTSMGLAYVICFGTAFTFMPPGIGMWTTAFPYFHHPIFYLTGLITFMFSIKNILILRRYNHETL